MADVPMGNASPSYYIAAGLFRLDEDCVVGSVVGLDYCARDEVAINLIGSSVPSDEGGALGDVGIGLGGVAPGG